MTKELCLTKTNGRIESILMFYHQMYNGFTIIIQKGSEEEKLVKVLENPMNWNLD
jgi:hypothetical protein